MGRRLRAATFHRFAGSPDGAIALLNELLREAGPGGERADILLELALDYWQALLRRLRSAMRR